MAADNHGTVMGNLGKKPELKHTEKGTAYCNCSIAVSKSFKKDDEWQKKTDWINFTLWGKKAESLSKILDAGALIVVTYELNPRKQTIGDKNINTLELNVQDVKIMRSANRNGSSKDEDSIGDDSSDSGGYGDDSPGLDDN